MEKSKQKILRRVSLYGTDNLEYIIYHPIEGLHDILNVDLPKKEQKWIRPKFPNFEKLTALENAEIYKREIKRIKHGVYIWINGELTYITGRYYFSLVHWKLKDSSTDYLVYTLAHRNYFYFLDLVENNNKCAGAIVFTIKRFGKTELQQAEMFCDALLSESGVYIVQALNDDEAQDAFNKTHFANEHLHESLPIWKSKYLKSDPPSENLIPLHRESTKDSITWKSIDGGDSDAISFMVKPTKLAGIQGKKIKRAFLDEFASLKPIKDMTLANWHSKAIAQATENSGSTVVGKIWLVATAENMESESLNDAQAIFEDSAEERRNANGFTPSRLMRMFIPYYLAGRGEYIDDYGNPKIEEFKKYYEDEIACLNDAAKAKFRRQNPETLEDVFNINRDGGLEADVIEILRHRRKELLVSPQFKYTIKRINGEIIVEGADKNEIDGQFTFEMFEPPQEHHLYRVGVDATSTAKNSTNKSTNGGEDGKEKSKFGLVVHKITGDNQYVDVANYFVRPEKRHLVEKTALWICMYYNKFGGCRAYPERNASAGSTLTDLFEGEGQQRILIRQLKHHNTDKLQEKGGDAYGIYIDGNNKDYRTSVMNKYLRLYGHKINSIRVIDNLLIYGDKNSDLADAYGVGNLACGNFEPDKQKKVETEPAKQLKAAYKWIDGKYTMVWE